MTEDNTEDLKLINMVQPSQGNKIINMVNLWLEKMFNL